MQINPKTNHIILIEKDYNCYTETQRNIIKQKIYEESNNKDYLKLDYQIVGYPKPGSQYDNMFPQ